MNEELIRKRKKQIGKDNLKFLSFAIIWACEKKSVNSVFYDYIFTYPALWIPK